LIRELAPNGLRGLLLVTFAAAYMSTISTQTNWGASYLVNDLYRRFLAPTASDRQLVFASRLASVLVMLLGAFTSWLMLRLRIAPDEAWGYLAALGGGLGSVFVLRWFWWRINAWSEIAAMLASIAFFLWVTLSPSTLAPQYTALLVATGSLVVWLLVTWLTAPEPAATLQSFYRRIRPAGPGWGPVAAQTPGVRPDGSLLHGVTCAVTATAIVWLVLPGLGALLFGQFGKAAGCLAGAALAALILVWLLRTKAAPRHAAG